MKELNVKLPSALRKYQNIIKKSIKPFIKINVKKCETKLWESKVGGDPYFPLNKSYPKDKNGNPMRLLAQVNFNETPNYDLFPSEGILQFFITQTDDLFGMNINNLTAQDNFRIVYHKKIIKDNEKLINDFSFVGNVDEDYFPLCDEGKMLFDKEYEPVTTEDYRFKKFFSMDSYEFFNQFNKQVLDFYYDNFLGEGHKIGGYAYFTQEDPRYYDFSDYEILLLQLDTDDNVSMMWGDCGVANFFIKKDDLINLNFDNVLYNWDCC